METRDKLRDLMSKADRSEELESLLEQVLRSESELKTLSGELGLKKTEGLGPCPTQHHRPPPLAPPPRRPHQAFSTQSSPTPSRPSRIGHRIWSKTLVEQALSGTMTFDKNLTRTFEHAIAAIDRKLSTQLNAIMHDPKFLKMEGSWRGLHYLVQNSETGSALKIRVLNASKRDLNRDLSKAVEFDQSQVFKKIYENEFGTPGGEPYGALIGDYEWNNHPDDIETLRLMSNIAAGGVRALHHRGRARDVRV